MGSPFAPHDNHRRGRWPIPALLAVWLLFHAIPSLAVPLNLHILVDQFGYRPGDPKVAVIRDPRVGFDSADRFRPGSQGYEVRTVSDDRPVFSGTLRPWHNGEVQASSGDVGWWFDFSTLNRPGHYYVYDRERGVRSATFRIDRAVYAPLLRAATRVFFYQRSGCEKKPPFAEPCWADAPAYVGPGQDLEARDIARRRDPASARNLSGGWFDAGDTNKYVTFSIHPIHALLTAYTRAPAAFTDDFDIPESGNGIPDVLDEVRWQLAWLIKMQNPDGTSLLKVGALQHAVAAPPSSDTQPRYYVGECSSATIAAAAMFAHAAAVFGDRPELRAEARELKRRAMRGFGAFERSGKPDTDCDDLTVRAGDADYDAKTQTEMAVVAAVYLWRITGEPRFDLFVRKNFRRTRPFNDFGWSRYDAFVGDALLDYAALPSANPAVRDEILAAKLDDANVGNGVYRMDDKDLYRNYLHDEQYHWGSNHIRMGYANTNLDMPAHRLDLARADEYRHRALETLHYLHGVNPLAMVYLSNMYALGATRSANAIYSQWFAPNTRWAAALSSPCGPPPGYLVGGPNINVLSDGVPANLVPPVGQPAQKSYRDWNVHGAESSYVVTEPSMSFQANYIKLVSAFVGD